MEQDHFGMTIQDRKENEWNNGLLYGREVIFPPWKTGILLSMIHFSGRMGRMAGGLESRKSKADSEAFPVLRLGELSFFETQYLRMGQFTVGETQRTTVTREAHQTSTHEHSKLK